MYCNIRGIVTTELGDAWAQYHLQQVQADTVSHYYTKQCMDVNMETAMSKRNL